MSIDYTEPHLTDAYVPPHLIIRGALEINPETGEWTFPEVEHVPLRRVVWYPIKEDD